VWYEFVWEGVMCQFSQAGRQALASQICHLSVNATVYFSVGRDACVLV
jgi:hypothetical protein